MYPIDPFDYMAVKKNINNQATKILHDIANAYQSGLLDDPSSSVHFCSLMALVCEGKVEGQVDETSGLVKWSLTPEYSTQLEAINKALMKSEIKSGKVVKGPWA